MNNIQQLADLVTGSQLMDIMSVYATAIKDNREGVSANANDITVLLETLTSLVEQGISQIDGYPVILKEEAEFEQLTASNTVPGVLYFGLEPLEYNSEFEFADGYALFSLTFDSGYVGASGTYVNGYISI